MRSVAGKVKGGSHRREAMCSGGLQARYREKPRLLKAGAPLLNQPRLRVRGLERRRSGVLRLLESLARPVRIVGSLGGDDAGQQAQSDEGGGDKGLHGHLLRLGFEVSWR